MGTSRPGGHGLSYAKLQNKITPAKLRNCFNGKSPENHTRHKKERHGRQDITRWHTATCKTCCKTCPFTLQKVPFYPARHGILPCKTWRTMAQEAARRATSPHAPKPSTKRQTRHTIRPQHEKASTAVNNISHASLPVKIFYPYLCNANQEHPDRRLHYLGNSVGRLAPPPKVMGRLFSAGYQHQT